MGAFEDLQAQDKQNRPTKAGVEKLIAEQTEKGIITPKQVDAVTRMKPPSATAWLKDNAIRSFMINALGDKLSPKEIERLNLEAPSKAITELELHLLRNNFIKAQKDQNILTEGSAERLYTLDPQQALDRLQVNQTVHQQMEIGWLDKNQLKDFANESEGFALAYLGANEEIHLQKNMGYLDGDRMATAMTMNRGNPDKAMEWLKTNAAAQEKIIDQVEKGKMTKEQAVGLRTKAPEEILAALDRKKG